jgi:epoxyqueuosine reductase
MNPAFSLNSLLLEHAKIEGFALAGAIDVSLAQETMPEHVRRYDDWIGAGRQGAMQYLVRGRDRRADPRLVMPGTQSLLCVAIPYPRRPGGAESQATGPRYARYIHGRDYHEVIAEKLERVMTAVAESWIPADGAEPLRWKVCVDTSAVLERSWAALAGLGWLGKNTLLIHPREGSYLFLGEVLLNHPTGQGPRPLPDYCGSCTRCLRACPTGAIVEPHVVDSTRCISYWSLEKRGALELAEADKRAMGPWVAGCDLCQEACPFNFKPVKAELTRDPDQGGATDQASRAGAALWAAAGPSAEHLQEWEALLREDLEDYRARVRDSALSRVKPAQFSRNLAIALANAAMTLAGYREEIDGGSPSAFAQFQARLLPLVESRLAIECDEHARVEWVRCLAAMR